MTFKNKKILITGGSGSLGRYLIKELLKYPVGQIVSLSRDEGLIKEAGQEISSDKVTFEIGDICDIKKVKQVLEGIDIVFHTASLKHVGIAEKFPREILRVNILGLLNILESAEKVSRFIYASSDKAISPINCYGCSKLFAEYLVRETNTHYRGKFLNIRCPNFLGSRGSVIDLWKKQVEKQNMISITDSRMTRYYITLPEAAKFFVRLALSENPDLTKVYYPEEGVGKFRLSDLAKAFVEVFGNKNTKIITVGPVPGEKIYEDYLCRVNLSTTAKLKKILTNL